MTELQILIANNDDIRLLAEKGYAIALDSGYLIVRDIPYLDNLKELQVGAIVTKLNYMTPEKVSQVDHQVFFAGGVPHNIDGTAVANLGGGATQLALSKSSVDVVVQRSFSNKPRSGHYDNFFAKIEAYVAIVSGPASQLYGKSALTYRLVGDSPSDSVFRFCDTLTSRAEILDLSSKLKEDVVAIVGLGGTGSYVLDFLAKTSVREIRLFDSDPFHIHNAFRSPGRLLEGEFTKTKAELYASRYENFRNGIRAFPKFVDQSCDADFEGVTFAFICVDKGKSRAGIFDLLIGKGIPFIDVGMGLTRRNDALNGMVRMTHFSSADSKQIRGMKLAEENDQPDDLYRVNIQTSELNALNAALAIIKFKQLRGFYFQEIPIYHELFELGDLMIVSESQLS